MPLSKQIELKAKKDIIDSINGIIDRYLNDGLDISQIKKYFSTNLARKNLIADINQAGKQYFDDNVEYVGYVKKMLREILYDRKSELETMKLQTVKEDNSITKYSQFEMNNEAVDYKDITAEYLFNDIGYANDDVDILASFFKTKEDYIEVKNQDYCIYSVTDFKTDITQNNRVRTEVLILADFQLEKMKENVVRKILSGIYSQIPQDVQFMGVLVKPHTIMDKAKLKESVGIIVDKNILNIVSSVTKYEYVQQYGENYHIWKKVK